MMTEESRNDVPPQAGQHQVAYHEAGHLVLACLTGVYLPGKTTLSIKGPRQAFAVYRPNLVLQSQRESFIPAAAASDAQGIEIGIVKAAGYAAEYRFLRQEGIEPDVEALELGALDDRLSIRDINAGLSAPYPGDGLFGRFVTAADGYLAEPKAWAATTAVAERLLASKTLTLDGLTAYETIQTHCRTDQLRLLVLT